MSIINDLNAVFGKLERFTELFEEIEADLTSINGKLPLKERKDFLLTEKFIPSEKLNEALIDAERGDDADLDYTLYDKQYLYNLTQKVTVDIASIIEQDIDNLQVIAKKEREKYLLQVRKANSNRKKK